MNDANRDRHIRAHHNEESRPGTQVVPPIAAEQPSRAAGIGTTHVGPNENVDGARDNDQESHVSPTDNDGETVARDEVVDQVGG